MAGDAHFIPGWQALNIRWEDVARRDRHPHPQNGTGEHLIGGGRARAVDIGELDDEVVNGTHLRHAYSVLGAFSRNFCMSQAPVGQRSAQRPQCRQRSSSLAMMRPVLSAVEM